MEGFTQIPDSRHAALPLRFGLCGFPFEKLFVFLSAARRPKISCLGGDDTITLALAAWGRGPPRPTRGARRYFRYHNHQHGHRVRGKI